MVEVRTPFPEYYYPLVWAWAKPVLRRVSQDGAPQLAEQFVEYLSASPAVKFAVYRDGELGGLISAQLANAWTAQLDVLFKPSFYGRKPQT
jgi:hypothetical protein